MQMKYHFNQPNGRKTSLMLMTYGQKIYQNNPPLVHSLARLNWLPLRVFCLMLNRNQKYSKQDTCRQATETETSNLCWQNINIPFTRGSIHEANMKQMYSKYTCTTCALSLLHHVNQHCQESHTL